MNFAEATDELRSLVLIEVIAKRMGVSDWDVRNMRRPPNARKAIPAAAGWETHIAELAREQSARLLKLADDLSPQIR